MKSRFTTAASAARAFFIAAFWGTALLKLALAAAVPFTQDEAYFAMWGRYPAWGYCEHPPLTGWMFWLLLRIGEHPLWLRLPAVSATLLIGWGIRRILRARDPAAADWTAGLFLLAPVNALYFIVTTDTPLLLLVFLSAWMMHIAARTERAAHWWAAGALLGAAFLAKFFAVLAGLGLLAFLFVRRGPRPGRIRALGWFLAGAVPFALIPLWWNYTHCWNEVLATFWFKSRERRLSLTHVASFLLGLWYLAGPLLPVWVLRDAVRRGARPPADPGGALCRRLYLAPLAVFALISAKTVIGLHWTLAFQPFLFLGWTAELTPDRRRRAARAGAIFLAIQTALAALALAAPLRWFAPLKSYDTLVAGFRARELAEAVRARAGAARLAARGYGFAALLSHHLGGRPVANFGIGSYHGRQDDILTDFRTWDGADVLLILRRADQPENYRDYFTDLSVETVNIAGAEFRLVTGRNFRYAVFREKILRPVKNNFYTLPAWLPNGGCYFLEKYFPDGCGCLPRPTDQRPPWSPAPDTPTGAESRRAHSLLRVSGGTRAHFRFVGA